jgi:segregation and condensation protein B
MNDLKSILESLLFVAEEPLSVDKLNSVLELADKSEIRTALEALREIFDNREGGFHLREVAGGWQLRTRPEYHEWIKRMLQPSPQRLSRASLETLAIVAYKQPVIRADIEFIRGVDSGGVLRQLMERKLIRVLGRKEIPGRPLIYATTKLFLELFDLKDLKDLPSPKEIEELSGSLRNETDTQAIPDTMENENETDIDTEATANAPSPEIYEENAETAPVENETDNLENHGDTGIADPVEVDAMSIPPAKSSSPADERIEPDPEMDSEQGMEPDTHDDSENPDPPVRHAYVVTSPDDSHTEPSNGDEINPAESSSRSITLIESSAESASPANERIEPDPRKNSEPNPELAANDDSALPDSSNHFKKDNNNLVS